MTMGGCEGWLSYLKESISVLLNKASDGIDNITSVVLDLEIFAVRKHLVGRISSS